MTEPLRTMDRVVPVAPLLAQSLGKLLDAPVPPIDWLIPGLIPRRAPGFLVSVPNAGKSFLTLQMVVAIATGRSFLGYAASAPMGAIYLSLEDPQDVVHRRLKGIVEVLKAAGEWTVEDEANLRTNALLLTPDWGAEAIQLDEDRFAVTPTTYLPKLMPTIMAAIQDLEEKGVAAGMFAIDTFAAASEGDENSAKDMKPILAATYQIAGKTGYSPLVCHHTAKGQSGARGQTKHTVDELMSTDWVRGSSALLGSARFVLQLAPLRHDQAEKAQLDPDKARRGGYLVFGASKQSVGPKGEWRVLEQIDAGEPGAGSWLPMPNSLDVMASLKGKGAMDELCVLDALLLTLHEGGPEQNKVTLAHRFCPTAKDKSAALRKLIFNLRRLGFIEKKTLVLTVPGRTRVKAFQAGTDGDFDE